jgi:hypothetical protein
VIDEDHVGSVASEHGFQDRSSQLGDILEGEGQVAGPILPRFILFDGGKAYEVTAGRKTESVGAGRSGGDQYRADIGQPGEALGEEEVATEMTQTNRVVAIEQ